MNNKEQIKFTIKYNPVSEESVELMPMGVANLLATLSENKTIFEKDRDMIGNVSELISREFIIKCDFDKAFKIHEFIRNYAEPSIYKSLKEIRLDVFGKFALVLQADDPKYDDKKMNLLGFLATLEQFSEIDYVQ